MASRAAAGDALGAINAAASGMTGVEAETGQPSVAIVGQTLPDLGEVSSVVVITALASDLGADRSWHDHRDDTTAISAICR